MNPIFFGLIMAMVDVVILSILKMKHIGQLTSQWVFVIAFIVYGCQALIFYKALDYSSLTNMNILWDVTSDILVTIVGIYLFKESVNDYQKVGIVMGVMGVILMSK